LGSVGLGELAQKELEPSHPAFPPCCNPLKLGERAFDAAKQNECDVDLKLQSLANSVACHR
jgi:hypothetical protein